MRFILEHIYQEIMVDSGPMTKDLFSISLLSFNVCQDQGHVQEREVSPFVIDLTYARKVLNS